MKSSTAERHATISLIISILLVIRVTSQSAETKQCLGGANSEEECFSSYDEIATSLNFYGKPIEELANISRAGNIDSRAISNVPAITKPLTLRVLEAGVESESSIAQTPIGYLTRYGYVKGILAATCGTDHVITSNNIVDAMLTFQYTARADNASLFVEMSKERCAQPDITFDEEGNLDASSAQLILTALDKTESNSIINNHGNHGKRKKRFALSDNGRGTLGIEKSTYTYKLHNEPEGQDLPFAQRKVDGAFSKWNEAIGSSISFVSAHDAQGEADFNLRFVADQHEDFTFSGSELAHAPFPGDTWHGHVHYRQNREWGDGLQNQLNFLYVTMHELGHLLGLKHSRDFPGSIMAPIIDSETIPPAEDVQLSDDERVAVKVLYGGSSAFCESDWAGYDAICFRVFTVSAGISWLEAAEECQKQDATLVSVTDGIRNSFLTSIIANGRTPYWIGRKSTDEGWLNGKPFGEYIPSGSTKMNPSKEKCLRTGIFASEPLWEFVSCEGKATKSDNKMEHFVCEKPEMERKPDKTTTQPPTTSVTRSIPVPTLDPDNIPCQNYIRAALKRSNYLYVFGTTLYFKYYYTSKRPTLQKGYPKNIRDNFKGIPTDFTAVVNDPYNKKRVYFLVQDDVYEWELESRRASIEAGVYQPKRNKPRSMEKVFKTSGEMRGAVKFDRNSVFLFSVTGKVGRFIRRTDAELNRKIGVYNEVEKWDYFDPLKIDAVADSYFKNFIIFFRGDTYFMLRKSDGRMPKKFKRPIGTDFDKLSICDVVAPLVEAYPSDISPDQALAEEDQAAGWS